MQESQSDSTKPNMPLFVIFARRTPETIARIVSLCHRRAIEIHRLVAEPAEPSMVLRIVLTVGADAEESLRLQANFYKLVDVLLVTQIEYVPEN